jgi:hypothetical protein
MWQQAVSTIVSLAFTVLSLSSIPAVAQDAQVPKTQSVQ